MTNPTNFPGPPDLGPPPNEGLIALKDRLPLGIALLALVVAIAALVVAVGDSDDDGVEEGEAEAAATTAAPAATTPPPIPTTTIGTVQTLPPTATTASSSQVVTATTAAESDAMVDEQPLVLDVVGIGHDSTLNVRETPGGQIVGKLGADATGIVPTGTVREESETTWYEVHAAGVVGWVSSEYVTPLGVTVDATTEIVALLGETPSAANMTALGRTVAGAVVSRAPESRVRISGAPKVGDVGEITMDVIGLPDDSIRGFRLHVFATPGDGGTFTLRNVESTVMCYVERGVSAEGLCN